ncbi:MAG: hypothetical protein K6G15_11960 [Desulfovibrio sp.]|nr:hypothetical protein [Desulfovibrio sp.]
MLKDIWKPTKLGFLTLFLVCVLLAGQARADLPLDARHFPDQHFRNWLTENVAQGKSVLTTAQIAALESMDISFGEIADLKGLEHFTALKELICFSNTLTVLDLAKNQVLALLRCQGNELATLDLSRNKALEVVNCDQNKLASLDLSALSHLVALSCRYNALSALDLSKNTALTELDVWGNALTSLDLSKNTALAKLNVLENPIQSLDLSKNQNLSEAALPSTAVVILPNNDKIVMADFKVVKAKGSFRLDLAKYGDKIAEVSVEPEGVDAEVSVRSAKGVHSFAPCDGKVRITYRLGKENSLDLLLFIAKEN